MARWLGQSICEMARVVGCSQSAVVSTYRQWSEQGQNADAVLAAQSSPMQEGNEGNKGYPVWSKPNEGLLWHKLQKIVMMVTGGSAHANPCPQSKVPAMHTWALELDLGAMEEGCLVQRVPFTFTNHVDSWVCVHCFPGEVMAPGYTVGRKHAGGGSVMFWTICYWETRAFTWTSIWLVPLS